MPRLLCASVIDSACYIVFTAIWFVKLNFANKYRSGTPCANITQREKAKVTPGAILHQVGIPLLPILTIHNPTCYLSGCGTDE
jgi:hypothetical protein